MSDSGSPVWLSRFSSFLRDTYPQQFRESTSCRTSFEVNYYQVDLHPRLKIVRLTISYYKEKQISDILRICGHQVNFLTATL